MKLSESKTYYNLAKAYAGECQARTRYEFIEYGARKEGLKALAEELFAQPSQGSRAAVVVQLFFGAGFAQIAGEVCVISLVSVAMIVAYARRGIWDTRARPSTKGNAAYSALCALGVSVVVLGIRGDVAAAVVTGICTFVLCFSLLCALMAYMQRRQKHEADELDD